MAHDDRFPRRHPLCTCPELTWKNLAQAPDRSTCQGGTIAHPPPLDADQMAALIAAWRRAADPPLPSPHGHLG